MRYTLSMRRPYLNEFYGAPEGLLPNINLLPESSKKFETGFRTLFGEIGYFHADDTNLIFLQQTSPNTSQYQNIENGYRDGMYINSDYYILDFWKVYFSYQYLISKMIIENEETYVPRSAKHYINTGTNFENILLGYILDYQALFGSYFNMNWQSPFYLDYANINEMDVPPLYNAGISYTLTDKLNSQNYTISFDIYNISNETYSSVSNSTGFIQQMQTNGYIGYPPPGRRFYISFIGEF
jgi:outer membrane receptor protein involved in Fe transport